MGHMSESKFADYYEILQVSSRADADTIERVFRHLAKRYHPDNQDSGNADAFSELVDAYRVLSDPVERAKYDIGYERVRENRWRLFGQSAAESEIENDRRVRHAILSILYTARRNDPQSPGVGNVELERLLGCPDAIIRFHLWYLKEIALVERIVSGQIAITAGGVDRLFELGGPVRLGPYLLEPGDQDAQAS
jgi:curved DNA-binding protein CbpA